MDSTGFTFDWIPRRWFCPRLATTLGLSIFAHLLIGLLFTVETTEKVTSPPPSDEIALLSRDVPEHRALLDFLQSESPLGALAHQLLPVGKTADAQYHYSFSFSQLVPLPPPRWTIPKASPLPGVPLLPKDSAPPTTTLPPHPTLTATPPRFPGTLSLSPSLQERLGPPVKIPPSPSPQLLEPVTFLIGIRDQGTVAFLMLQKTSGDSSSDTQADAFLRHLTFEKSEAPVEWGSVTLQWASPVLP